MDLLTRTAVVAACIYLGLVAVMYLMQRKLMYFPVQALPAPFEIGAPDLKSIRLATEDGLELVAWRKPAAREDAGEILYLHGNGGNIAGRADKVRPLLEAGHGILLLSYRGYGGNPGWPSEAGLIADARAAYDYLVGEGVPPRRIVLLGESLGSGVAVQLAAEREVGAVILEAPFTSAADVGQRAYPFVPVKLLMKDRFDSLSRIDLVGAPLLVVHGERDRVVPVVFGRRLLGAAKPPKEGVFLPDAGHADMQAFGLLERELDFLARQLR